MTKKDIDDIISIICPNDEDFEKTCISPAYLKKELEVLALEQEPILDKIKAEIEHMTITEGGDDYVRKMAELFSLKMKVLQIIDKYKAESEDNK